MRIMVGVNRIMKIRKRKADIVFSTLVRNRSRWTCENCGVNKQDDPQYFDCAHVFGRRNLSLRWHPMGAIGLCRKCHMFFTEHWYDWYEFCKQKFGEELLAEIRLVSNQTVKWHPKLREEIYQHMKNELSIQSMGDDFQPHEVMHEFGE